MTKMVSHPFEAILFDLDGTLVDSAPDLGGAADKMRTDRGMKSLGVNSYRSMAGSGAKGMIGIAFGLGVEHERFAALREEFFKNYEARLTELTKAFDGVHDLIVSIENQKLKWGVVTNKAERFALPLTQSMRLFDKAQAVIGGDTTPFSKPHPEPLLEAARRLGVRPGNCMYVGDDQRDIAAGRAAGMTTVAAAYGYLGVNAGASAWNADYVIASPLELLKLLPMA